MLLSEAQIRRYSRHILIPQVGGEGQERLLAARVRIPFDDDVGASCVAAAYLAAAGVGELALRGRIDDAVTAEHVRLAMPLHAEDQGRPLLEALRLRLEEQNPDMRVLRASSSSEGTRDLTLTGPTSASPAEALRRGGDAASRMAYDITQT